MEQNENNNMIIEKLAYNGAYKIYGKQLPDAIKIRLDNELKAIIDNNFSGIYLVAQKIAEKLNKAGYIIGCRGALGSSLVAYCLGITEVDPIKYEIPFEVFVGIDGDREPDISLYVPNQYKQEFQKYVEDTVGNRSTFRIYGNNIPNILYKLKESTKIEPTEIPLDDKQTLEKICSCNITEITDFNNANDIISETKPSAFEDLIKILGLVHGTDTWKNNAQDLIKDEIATLKDVIACRDDIMNYLISLGVETRIAFHIMETVRKGRIRRNREPNWEVYKDIMKNHNVPEWYIKSCKKISYLFPRAHIVGYLINYFRISWYRVHYPKVFDEIINKFENETDIED